MNDGAVRLTFPAKADYLLLARLALSGLARVLPVGDELLADLKLAVTEACGNAVRHAYEGDAGTITVVFLVTGDRLDMIVEDQGSAWTLSSRRRRRRFRSARAGWACPSSVRSSTSSRSVVALTGRERCSG